MYIPRREGAGHPVRHAVRATGLEPGKESAAVQDRNAGRQHTLPRLDVELLGGGSAHVKLEPLSGAGHFLDADALHEPAVALAEFGGEAVQQRHRIKLCLGAEAHAAAERERHVGVVDPLRIQSGCGTSLQFLAGRRNTLLGLRVGVGILVLHRDAMRFAVPQQPILALAVALHVLRRDLGAVLGDDLRQLGALQQADLRGGVARRAGAERVRLQHEHIPAGACQQHRGDQTGDSRTDDCHIGRPGTGVQRARRKRLVSTTC